jgi:hypothetical protein
MRTFVCDSCGGPLFFENDACLACGRVVGFRSDEIAMCTAEGASAAGLAPCRNWTEHNACNWFAAAGSDGYCAACELNELVPDLGDPRRRALWIEAERAKRRLVFTLIELGLPLSGSGRKRALRFRLLADERVDTGEIEPPADEPIYTGHAEGRLTLNVVEADSAHRESLRQRLNEPYRTVLGHLRHEIGHYYWYLLVDGAPRLAAFRELFGDERASYAQAQRRHYDRGAPDAWQESFVSAYASMHPWEDFAETWAHYIHIVDTLESASASELALGGRALASPLPLAPDRRLAVLLGEWLPLTVCLNQLNRSMGLPDAYPFVVTQRVVDKLAFVHDLCLEATHGLSPRPQVANTAERAPATALH